MLLRCLRAELIKFRRSPVWLAFVVLPVFPAILGTMNYLGNLGCCRASGTACGASTPCSLPCSSCRPCWGCSAPGSGGWSTRPQLEQLSHRAGAGGGPVPCQTDLGGGHVPALPGLDRGTVYPQRKAGGPRRSHPAGATGVAAVRGRGRRVGVRGAALFQPDHPGVRSTRGFGLVGGILGLLVTAQGFGYAFPYSLLCIGMRANNPNMELDFAPFLLSAFVYTAVFTLLAVRYLRRHDVAAE